MQTEIEVLKALSKDLGIELKDCTNGHWQVKLGKALVNYWPASSKKTAHNPNTGKTKRHATAADVVQMLGVAPNQKPASQEVSKVKKAPRPKRAMSKAMAVRNPAGIKNLYSGSIPPWEFPTMIMADSDLKRVRAYRLISKALELLADAEDQEMPQEEPAGLQKAAMSIQQKHAQLVLVEMAKSRL